MSGLAWIVLLVMALLVFWGIGAFTRIKRLHKKIIEAYALFDQQLCRRGGIVQQLMELLRSELVNEQAAFDALAGAQIECDGAASAVRSKPAAADPVAALAVAAAVHAAALARLMALIDQHPELHSREDVKPLLAELKLTEEQRKFARQLFNEAVRAYNEALDQFPTRVLVSIYGFKEARSL